MSTTTFPKHPPCRLKRCKWYRDDRSYTCFIEKVLPMGDFSSSCYSHHMYMRLTVTFAYSQNYYTDCKLSYLLILIIKKQQRWSNNLKFVKTGVSFPHVLDPKFDFRILQAYNMFVFHTIKYTPGKRMIYYRTTQLG